MSRIQTKRSAKRISNYLLDTLLQKRNGEGGVLYGPDILRQSQEEATNDSAQFLKRGITAGHIIQPGGAGKLHEIVMLSEACYKWGGKTLIVVPSIVGIENTLARFRSLAPKIKVGAVYSEEKNFGHKVTVMTYASLLISLAKKKIKPKQFSLLLADEGHHFLTDLSDETLDEFSNAVKIAFTATPRYYAGKELAASRHFGQLFYNLTHKEAVERKESTPSKARLIDTNIPLEEYEKLFAKGLPVSEDGGVYERAINQAPWNQTFVDLYQTYSDEETGHRLLGDKTLVFTAGIQHAEDIARQFNDLLLPYINGRLKYTEAGWDIREALEAKGINPKKVKFVCAPVWGSMDREHGWPRTPDEPSYTKKQLMEGFTNGEILCLSCDKILAESTDIPEITTVLNATPTCSFVRAGQRGMRPSRIFDGDPGRGLLPKAWAYVFDALPSNWQTSMAAPVLFSEFVLKDLYTMHGVEPPAKNGPDKEVVTEQNPGYRVLWDVETLLSIGAMMETRRSIAKAEVVPAEFLNDSLAVKELIRLHETLPPKGRRFIAGVYKDWEQAYKAAGQPVGGMVRRYKHSIPAEHCRFANNRLYIHRNSLPIIWQEQQLFKTPKELERLLFEDGHYVTANTIEDALGVIQTYLRGEYYPREYMSKTPFRSDDEVEAINASIRKNNERKLRVLRTVGAEDLRNYDSHAFASLDLTPALKALTADQQYKIERVEELKDVRAREKGWTPIVSLIDDLADEGFSGLGFKELIEHAAAAARTAESGEEYGGELFFPGEFQFRGTGKSNQPTKLPTDKSRYAHIRTYRVPQFIEAIERLHPRSQAEPSIFPATVAECFAALRRQTRGELSWREFTSILNRMLNKDGRDSYSDRQARLKKAFDLSREDIVLPKTSRAAMKISRHGYDSFKRLFAMKPPSGYMDEKQIGMQIRRLTGGWLVHRIMVPLHQAITRNAERPGSIDSVTIASVSIPLSAIWKRDPYNRKGNAETVIDDPGIFYSEFVVSQIIMLCTASDKVEQEIERAFRSAPESAQNTSIRGVNISRISSYVSSTHELRFRTHEINDTTFYKIMENYLRDMQAGVAEVPADAAEVPVDLWMGRLARRAIVAHG